MSKGFLIFAQNTDNTDYIAQAYALALSIKKTQNVVKNVSLVTCSNVPEEYAWAFDNIIPIPWYDDVETRFFAEHRWKLFHVSPYDETMVLDSDMLFLTDKSYWWEYCKNYDLKFCSMVSNYKHDHITVDPVHRKAFISNQLPNVYFALHYFNKSDAAYEFYKTLEFVCKNWELCYGKFAPLEYQNWLSMDLATAISLRVSGLEHAVDSLGVLEFVHMKPGIQGWKLSTESWQDSVQWLYNRDFTIGNIKQEGLLHYIDKDFITPELIDRLK